MMFWLGTDGQIVVIDLVPKLLPAPLTEHQCTQAQNNARPAFAPAHAGATKPLFDECLACRLDDPGTDGYVLGLIARVAHRMFMVAKIGNGAGRFFAKRFAQRLLGKPFHLPRNPSRCVRLSWNKVKLPIKALIHKA